VKGFVWRRTYIAPNHHLPLRVCAEISAILPETINLLFTLPVMIIIYGLTSRVAIAPVIKHVPFVPAMKP